MDKLSELKEKLAIAHSKFEGQYISRPDGDISITALTASCFKAGFSAAMELQLPVRFAKWLSDSQALTPPIGWTDKKTGEWRNEKDLYYYFIQYIYQPE